MKNSCLFMECLGGCTVREFFMECGEEEEDVPVLKKARNGDVVELNEMMCDDDSEVEEISSRTRTDAVALKVAFEMGRVIAQIHNANVIHGDLTTSNLMLTNSNDDDVKKDSWMPKVALIDFGLSGLKAKDSHEEKAVDLYVLERSFTSTHPGSKSLVEELHRAYKGASKTSDSVLQRLHAVRLRGRKRECFG